MSKTVTTRAVVLRETETSLILLCEAAPTILHHTVKEGDIVRSIPVTINKKYLYPGSDPLGIPNEKKDNGKQIKGEIVLPTWYATQKGIWKRDVTPIRNSPGDQPVNRQESPTA